MGLQRGDFNMNGDSQLIFEKDSSKSQQSLLAAMNKFSQAVSAMDDTIMVPSRLLDVPLKNGQSSPNDNRGALVPFEGKVGNGTDLYSFYMLLNTISTDLVRGPPQLEDDEGGDPRYSRVDEQTKQVANMFRHHLSGLHSVLNQLTDAAHFLTQRYTDEIENDAAKMSGSP
ncbi:mid1-interacting protein 1-B-like [Lineus longissimus]|uniref:mid1-interacting protein 1-B-like n=1 Tax=Lineus longissimus TaxID=88925 RepID=UPI00315D66AC